MLSIVDTQDMAGILDQSMLKTASGTDERPALFAREADGPECSLHAVVWAGWSTPQGIHGLQHGLAARLSE